MIVKLTARTVESLKPTPGRRMDYHDTEVSRLTLRVAYLHSTRNGFAGTLALV